MPIGSLRTRSYTTRQKVKLPSGMAGGAKRGAKRPSRIPHGIWAYAAAPTMAARGTANHAGRPTRQNLMARLWSQDVDASKRRRCGRLGRVPSATCERRNQNEQVVRRRQFASGAKRREPPERSVARGAPALRQAQGVVSLSNHASDGVGESEGRSPSD